MSEEKPKTELADDIIESMKPDEPYEPEEWVFFAPDGPVTVNRFRIPAPNEQS